MVTFKRVLMFFVAAGLALALVFTLTDRTPKAANHGAASHLVCYPVGDHHPNGVAKARAHGWVVDYDGSTGWWTMDGVRVVHVPVEDTNTKLCGQEINGRPLDKVVGK